ncbi:MAG TPA: septum formation initiator family protein [Vicinamibacterales bacterium]|nr:septum formation initiator family protein [Vicinamibacterales bacterium]
MSAMRPVQPQATPANAPAAERRPRVRHRLRTPQEARAWRRRMTAYALFAFVFAMMVNALVGENGYLATLQARSEQARLAGQVARVRLKNQETRDEIERLRTDPKALEEAARRELNMIKKGETVVIVKDKKKQ